MSKISLYEGPTQDTPPAGVVVLYPKTDGRWYFKASDGIEYALRPEGAGTGDLKSDGSVPLIANYDVGPYKLTALQIESDATAGTAPFLVASPDLVANLNADLLDGQEGSYYASVTYVDNAVVGLLDHKGGYDASTNTPDLDTSPSGIKKGDAYVVTVAGTFYATDLEIGDWMYANIDDPASAADWTIVQGNLDAARLAAAITTTGSGEIAGLTEKVAPVDGDWAIIEDSEAANVKKKVQLSNMLGGGGGLIISHKIASFTAEAGYKYLVDTTGAAVVVTLPAGVDLDNIAIADVGHYAAINNITINPNGLETIDGDTTFIIDQNEGDIDLGYDNANTNWAVSSNGSPDLVNAADYFTKYRGQNLQTGTAYELVLNDAGKVIEMNNAAANTLTIPANSAVAFPVDTRIDVIQYGAGQTTIAITTDTLTGTATIGAQYQMVSLWKRAATEWVVIGGA